MRPLARPRTQRDDGSHLMLFGAKVAVARSAARASRAAGMGGGTTLPGRVLLALQRDAIGRLGERLAAATVISATNGKTTTAKMAATILEDGGFELCRNRGGANLGSGVASALLESRPGEVGLFEVDEAALPGVAEALGPGTIVLGNLFRDQLDRYGELELVGERWRETIAAQGAQTETICNVDDPLVASIGCSGARPPIGFGIEDVSGARGAMQHASDSKWCPRCGTRLAYGAIFFGHLGHWHCPRCGLTRPRPAIRATSVRPIGLEATELEIEVPGGRLQARLPIPGLYNVYNALAAVAVACAHGIEPDRIGHGLERFSAAFGRFERIDLAGHDAVLLLIKNPAGTNEVIRTLAGEPARKTLLVALNDRIADGRDVSWIWDVDFEELAGQAASVVTTGTRAAEMALRLKYAGLSPSRVAVERDPDRALDLIGRAETGPVFLLATYTAMLDLRRLLVERGLLRPYWEAA
jgi:UDP-N-acetylmuramyl tripeptide synthase